MHSYDATTTLTMLAAARRSLTLLLPQIAAWGKGSGSMHWVAKAASHAKVTSCSIAEIWD